MKKEQWDYILEYLDNLREQANKNDIRIESLENELFKIEKALKKKSSKYWN